MKRIILALLFCGFFVIQEAQGATVDKVVAIVNDEIITASDLEVSFYPLRRQYESLYKDKELDDHLIQGRRQMLETMIENILILQDAKKRKVEVLEEEVTDYINKVKVKFESEELFIEALQQQGLTKESFTSKIRKQILVSNYRRYVVGRSVEVYPKEELDFYNSHKEQYTEPEEVNVSQIYVLKGENAAASRQKIEEVMTELSNGKSFDELVKEFSQTNGEIKAGELGFLRRGQILKEIEAVVFNLKVGGVSNVVETAASYHVVKVTARKERKELNFDEVEKDIKNIVFNQKAEAKYRDMVQKLRKEAFVEIKIAV